MDVFSIYNKIREATDKSVEVYFETMKNGFENGLKAYRNAMAEMDRQAETMKAFSKK